MVKTMTSQIYEYAPIIIIIRIIVSRSTIIHKIIILPYNHILDIEHEVRGKT